MRKLDHKETQVDLKRSQVDHKKSDLDRKKSKLDRRIEKLFRRFRWHRWFSRFFGHRQSYHLQIMEEIADELDDLCAQEEADQ